MKKATNKKFYAENEDVIEGLRECPFFEGLPNQLLKEIAPHATTVQFQPGQEILKEGEVNENLYFLLSGTIGVYVEGELVAQLKKTGDLIGEMSVISSKPVTATIIAMNPVELLAIRAKNLSELSGSDAQAFQHTLYRVFALILTEKLSETNNKAKMFEATNRELQKTQFALEQANADLERKVKERTAELEQQTDRLKKSYQALEEQNAALLASYRKMEDLYQQQDTVFKNISDLTSTQLSPLLENLQTMATNSGNSQKDDLDHMTESLSLVIDRLKPIQDAYHQEQALEAKKVLLLETEKKQQIIAKMALGGTGVQLDIASTPEEGKQLLEKSTYHIVCTGTDMVDLTSLALDKNPNTKLVFMTSEDIPSYLPFLHKYKQISSVVSRNDEDRVFTIKNITTTVSKLVSQDLFGLEKYLGWGVDVQERKVVSSGQRRELIEDMSEYFSGVGIRNSIIERCATVAEELLMNAIYDAPTGPDKKSIYNHLPRTVPIHLKPHEQGRFRFATDGVLAAISVEDPFGGLSRGLILKYLDSCYGGKAGSLNENKGGAGMGLFQLIGTSDLVIFNVRSGARTEVIALFHLDHKVSKNQHPSFHFFYQ